ncbi:MAG: sarcosine oxidase subunit gamma [Alphaproteobacteria bacterium]
MASAIHKAPAGPELGLPGRLPGIRLGEKAPASIMLLARPIEGPSLSALLSGFGVAQLPQSGRSARAGPRLILGVGPRRWWLVEEETAATGPAPSGLCAGFGVAVEIGDAWSRFRIAGEAILELLAKGSSLDLDPRVFAEGSCALAAFAQLHTLLHRPHGFEHFDLYCGRSYARSLHEWLIEAATEFGCEAPIGKGGATPEVTT